MCQNCNQNNCNGCTQEVTICNQCPPETCDCPILGLSTDCSTYTADDIECNSVVVVPKNTILSDALNQIVSWSCTKFDELANYLRLRNVGTGVEIYAGDNLIGEKKIRTLIDSGLINIVQGTDDITISVDEATLNTFIEANQKTYSATNIGAGAQVYKDATVVGDNTQLNLRKINTSNSGTGAEILKTELENTNDISIIGRTLVSTSLNIIEGLDEVSIEIPAVSEIPALIVNSAYTGDEELGTASKPFKTIQNALDAYVGTGGRGTILDAVNPELLGSTIEVYKGTGTYNFIGDFDYKDLNIIIKEGAVISSEPTSGWLMDFSLFGIAVIHNPIINIEEGGYLYCNQNGFNLEGGNFLAGTNLRKSLRILGNTVSTGIVLTGTLESYILFQVDENNLEYVNGGYPHLEISSFIATTRGRMFVLKGNGNVVCDANPIYILTDTTVTITNTHPIIELHNNSILRLKKSSVFLNKTPLITYTQFVSMYNAATLECIDTIFLGDSVYFAYNNSVANTAIVKLDSCKMYIVTTTSFAGTVSGVWNTLVLTNNNMPSTDIDTTTTVIVPSAINTIGGNLIETLNTHVSKAAAVTAGLPTGAKFINKVDVTAGSFVVGLEYKILTIGTTDFTLIGASANTVGLYFTASGAGTGDGTASLIRVDIVY